MNIFRKRSTIVLASIGAVGAIAAIATAASFALFYDPVAPQNVTFASGNVTLNNAVTSHCSFDNINPGFSTQGYPGSLGDQSQPACTVDIDYTGSMDAFLALDVSVQTAAGTSVVACNGGDATGTASCAPLYNPSPGASQGSGLEVYVLANGDSYTGPPGNTRGAENGPTQAFGIGSDQTISAPGTNGVDLGYSANSKFNAVGQTPAVCNATTGDDCPVAGSSYYRESFSVYAYWPLDTQNDQNVYQNSTATVTLTEHAVQAADNPLFECPSINDSQNPVGAYESPDQPSSGWGAGLTAGETTYPTIGTCPTIDSTTTGTDWTSSTPGSELLPFYHPKS